MSYGIGDEISGWAAGQEYDIGAEDLSAYMGAYSIGDERSDRMAQLLTAASAGWDASGHMGWESGANLAQMAANARSGVGQAQAIGKLRQLLQAKSAQNVNLQNQLAALRQNQISFPRLAGAYPTFGPGGLPSYPPAMQGAAASPIRGGFGQTGALSAARVTAPSEVNGTPLGFDSGTAIAIAGTAVVVSAPQQIFRCERLFIPQSVAVFFLILDIKVGNVSQLSNGQPVPAEVFSQTAVGASLRFNTAQVSQQVSITVQNIDTLATHRFLAAMFGTQLS